MKPAASPPTTRPSTPTGGACGRPSPAPRRSPRRREETGLIFVTGATGAIGSELARLLAGSGVPARALCRSPEKAEAARRRGLESALGDLDDPASLEAGMDGCDRLFLLSPPALDQAKREKAAIDAAGRAGVGRIVKVSAADANLGSPVPWARAHAEIDLHLRRSGPAWTVLKPTAFMQNFLSLAPTVSKGRLYQSAGEGRAAYVDARDVAAVAHRVLTGDSGEHEGATHFLTGPEALTMREVAARLSEVLGQKVRYTNVPRFALRLGMRRAGVPGWMADGLAAQFAEVMAGGHAVDVTGEVERLSGRPPRSFEDFARNHRRAFAGAG